MITSHKNIINRIISDMYTKINLKLSFSNKLIIGTFFNIKRPYKMTWPPMSRSRVSRYFCENSTTSKFWKKSSFLEQSKQYIHRISFDNFNIITKTNNTDLWLIESIYINKIKLNLNESLPVDLNVLWCYELTLFIVYHILNIYFNVCFNCFKSYNNNETK